MDWLFENDNANTVLTILASEEGNPKVLTQEAIQIFIDMAWEVY